ncbi:MAG TPA: caspase family protein, partial [Candidatus Paceibacterota bacterium]
MAIALSVLMFCALSRIFRRSVNASVRTILVNHAISRFLIQKLERSTLQDLQSTQMGMWNFMRLIKKTSIHIGINDYKGPNLSGCVNDAQGMAFMFRTLGYTGPDPILDQEATRANVWEALDEAVANLKWGHRLVVTYSGHGTQLPDQDSDEFD